VISEDDVRRNGAAVNASLDLSCVSSVPASEVIRMYRKEHLWCVLDAGPIKSTGRFVTRRGETLEVGLCHFDGAFSGFRWNEERGWEPIFVEHSEWDEMVLSIYASEDNSYTEAELAGELERFRAARFYSSPWRSVR
jgi:hypothetical protein